jgi:hypothetical protein
MCTDFSSNGMEDPNMYLAFWVDSNNYIGRERKKYLEVNDAQTLLEFLKNKQLEDPFFMPYN